MFASIWQELASKFYNLKDPGAMTVFAKDNVSIRRYLLIYRGDFDRTSLFTFMLIGKLGCILALIGLALRRDVTKDEDYDPYDELDWTATYYGAIAVLFSLVALGHVICRRYVIRMYYDKSKKDFVGVTFNNWAPWRVRKFSCKAGDGKAVTSMPKSQWMLGNVRINNSRYILTIDDFKFPIYYNVLLGYQKADEIDSLRDSNLTADMHYATNKPGFEKDDKKEIRLKPDFNFSIKKEDI